MGRRILRPVGFAVLLGVFTVPAPAAGQGSSVYNQSACASAKAGAVVAAPCMDASSIYYNPALMSLLPSSISAGFTAVYNSGTFTYDTTGAVVERDPAIPLVPQLYASFRLGESQRMAAGIGVWAPYGLGIQWPEDFEGRFISWKSSLRGIYIQPSVAYQVLPGKLAVGGGVQVVSGGIELNQRIDAPVSNLQLASLGVPLGTDIAAAQLSGSGIGFGGQLSAYYQVSDQLAIGARYMFPVKVSLTGEADFEQIAQDSIVMVVPGDTFSLTEAVAPQFADGAALADQGADASLTFPPQAVIGFRYAVTGALALSADYQWTGWSTFDEIVAEFDGAAPNLSLGLDYNDTHTFRTGATYALSDALEGRAGFIYNTAASPDHTVTPILPEAERQLYSVGFGYSMGSIQADLYYNYVNQADRRGRLRSDLPGPGQPSTPEQIISQLNVGVYGSTAHLVGLTVSYVFGDAR
jgi:long-chain fatty acid transport protein